MTLFCQLSGEVPYVGLQSAGKRRADRKAIRRDDRDVQGFDNPRAPWLTPEWSPEIRIRSARRCPQVASRAATSASTGCGKWRMEECEVGTEATRINPTPFEEDEQRHWAGTWLRRWCSEISGAIESS